MNGSTLDEGCLVGRDDLRKNRSKSVGQKICNYFERKVQKAYGSKIIKGGRVGAFGDEDEEKGKGDFEEFTR